MIVKGHEAKSTFLPGRALLHDVDALDLAVLLKVLQDVVLLGVLLNAADKDLLHRQVGAWFVGVLGQGWGSLGTREGMTEHRDAVAGDAAWLLLFVFFLLTSLDTARLGSTTRPSTL